MTSRQFDPVFSAALRNELEALAEHAGPSIVTTQPPVLRRPQLWVSIVTALVLVAATVGLLRLTDRPPQPAERTPAVVDPLSRLVDPASRYYVARSLTTLVDARGTGPGTAAFVVPAGMSAVRVYLNCAGSRQFEVSVDSDGGMSSGCDRDSGSSATTPIEPGHHTARVRVAKGVAWALTIIPPPAPTVSAGALLDPLTAVRDLRNPDAIPGDPRPLLQLHGRATGDPTTLAVPQGVRRLRVLLVCTPSSATTAVRIDGHDASGCMNSIAHWFDLTPSAGSIPVQVVAPDGGAWSLLVVPAPRGAKDSPESTRLPYPPVSGAVLGRARGAGGTATGTYPRTSTVTVTTTCRGTGWLEVDTGDGTTATRGEPCSTTGGSTGFEGQDTGPAVRRWRVTPHGDISWTMQLAKG